MLLLAFARFPVGILPPDLNISARPADADLIGDSALYMFRTVCANRHTFSRLAIWNESARSFLAALSLRVKTCWAPSEARARTKAC